MDKSLNRDTPRSEARYIKGETESLKEHTISPLELILALKDDSLQQHICPEIAKNFLDSLQILFAAGTYQLR